MEENISRQQSENTQTPPSALSNSDLKSKLPLVSAGILLLALVGTIGFLLGKSLSQPKTSPPPVSQVSLTPTPENPALTSDPTANWKTYRNEEYGFEFKYPPGFYYEEIKNQTKPVTWLVYIADSTKSPNVAHYPEIDVGVLSKNNNLSLHNWLEDKITTKDNYNNPDPEDKDKIWWGVKNINNISLGNLKAISFSSSNYASSFQDNVLIDHGDKIFIFQSITTLLGAIDKNLFDLILSTFKFLD